MPTNYQESGVTGSEWKRSYEVKILNPYGGVPSVYFSEEIAVLLSSGNLLKQNAGGLEVIFDPSAQIPLIDPWTGEPLTNVEGVQQYASHIEAYILLHSLYIQNATIRDTPVLPAPDEPTEPPPTPEE